MTDLVLYCVTIRGCFARPGYQEETLSGSWHQEESLSGSWRLSVQSSIRVENLSYSLLKTIILSDDVIPFCVFQYFFVFVSYYKRVFIDCRDTTFRIPTSY